MTGLLLNAFLVTISSLVIYLTILLLRFAFHKKLSSRVSYCLWLLLLLRLCLPFSLDVGTHLYSVPEDSKVGEVIREMDEQAESRERVYLRAPASEQSDYPLQRFVELTEPTDEAGDQNEMGNEQPHFRLSWQFILLTLWLFGALIVWGRQVYLSVVLNQRLALHGSKPDRETIAAYHKQLMLVGMKRPLNLLVVDDITSPAMTVRFRPCLLLPKAIAEQSHTEQFAFAVRHELTHYRSGDHIVLLLLTFLKGLWWFNPAVWLIAKPMRTDMETSCDATVTKDMSKAEKLRYTEMLLNIGKE